MKISLAAKPVLAAILLAFFVSIRAQRSVIPEFTLRAAVQRNIPELKKQINRYELVNFPASEVTEFVRKNGGGNFRINSADTAWDILLQPSGITSKNYRLKILTPEGTKVIDSKPDYLYKGKVLGSSGGEVRLTIKNGFVSGYVQYAGRELNIEPLAKYTKSSSSGEYIIYEKENVVADSNLRCAFETPRSLDYSTNSRVNSSARLMAGQCRKVKILQVTDYELLQEFNNNLDSLETFLFTNMNEVQGLYHGFNFNPDSTADVGEDSIQFEVFETIISTCPNCDILSQGNNSTELNGLARTWMNNYAEPQAFLSQFWTPRRLFSQTIEAVGITNGNYCDRSVQFLRYYTSNPVALRFLAAHETGHSLGCIHDNEVKRDVNQFIMNSYFVPSATRFSRVSDFGGMLLNGNPYSSQLTIKNYVLLRQQCFNSCAEPINCDIVDGFKVTFYELTDSAKVSWNGSGKFSVLLKEKDLYTLSTVDSSVVDDNYIIFKNLKPCTAYQVIVSRICAPVSTSPAVSFMFLNGPIEMLNYSFSNLRFSTYDLKLNLKHNLKPNTPFYVFVDHKPYQFYSSNSAELISINDLFSDGARHRIDIRKEFTNQSCTNTYYYQAPYFREKALLILKNNFNDSCNIGEWKDSVLLTRNSVPASDPLTVSEITNSWLVFLPGSIDSSCFIYYASLANSSNPAKRFSLTSPVVDASMYSDVVLSFDYNYWTMYWRDTSLTSYLKAEIYDGNQWQEVFRQKEVLYFHNTNFNKPIFDTLPPRVFISVDSSKSRNFRLRFVFDNGMVEQSNAIPFYLAALDNIRVDGYLSSALDVSKLKYRIYPNPTHDEIIVIFNQRVPSKLNYRIIDLMGRTLDVGQISNDRIKLKMLTRGIYMLQVFNDATLVDETKKIIKN